MIVTLRLKEPPSVFRKFIESCLGYFARKYIGGDCLHVDVMNRMYVEKDGDSRRVVYVDGRHVGDIVASPCKGDIKYELIEP